MNIDKFLKQDITWWGSAVPNGSGNFTYATPTTIKGRWEDLHQLFVTVTGEEKVSDARVFVDRDLIEGEWLYLGVSTEANPQDVSGAHRIRRYKKIPSLSTGTFLRNCWL